MPRQQTPDHTKKGRTNPGAFSPDDDEAQESDRTRASDMPEQGQQRQAQDQRRRPEQNVEQMPDEGADEGADEAGDDEDESDQISQRP